MFLSMRLAPSVPPFYTSIKFKEKKMIYANDIYIKTQNRIKNPLKECMVSVCDRNEI